MEHFQIQAEVAPSSQFVPTKPLSQTTIKKTDSKKNGCKKETDKPKRPLSAYNLFFQHQRNVILESTPSKYEGDKPRRSHGKIGFATLARSVAAKWNTIDPVDRKHFDGLAAKDKERYKKEMDIWKAKESAKESTKKTHEPLPMSAASDFMGCMGPSPSFNAHSIVKCNLMAQASANQHHSNSLRMPLNKFRAMSQANQMGNAQQRLMPPHFFSNNHNGMRGGSASQVVGQALALLEEDIPSFQPSSGMMMMNNQFMNNYLSSGEPENAFMDNPEISDLASKLDDDCLGLLSGLL